MTQSQVEIKAIQAKLQAIQAGRSSGRSPASLPPMVELTPNSTTATVSRQLEAEQLAAITEILRQSPASVPLVGESASNIATATASRQIEAEQLAAIAETLKQRSATYLKQFQPSPPSPPPDPPEPQTNLIRKRLEAQVQRINDLSAAQEAAILKLKAIVQRAERDWRATELEQDPFSATDTLPPLCEYQDIGVPCIQVNENGSYVLTNRSLDLFKAEREAALNAQSLRQRPRSTTPEERGSQHPNRSSGTPQSEERVNYRPTPPSGMQKPATIQPLLWKQIWKRLKTLIQSFQSHRSSSKATRPRAVVPTEMPDISIQDGAMWVLGAVVVRVGLDLLLVAQPGLWIPVVGLIAAPAAIAVYRTTVAPQSGFMWGYRLLLIMVGLLLGGRLSL